MRSKSFRALVRIVTLSAFLIFGLTLYNSVIASRPESELPYTGNIDITDVSNNPEEYPSRLIIPTIDINTAVQHVGINQKGKMANPAGFKEVGWYKYGPVPGSRGNAVIAGHFNNGLDLPGVFYNLDKLQPGDDIYIENAAGEQVAFQVTESRIYNYDDPSAQELFTSNNSPTLVLITCDGAWIQNEKTYDKRLVVFAELSTEL